MSLLDVICSLNSDMLSSMEIKDIFAENEYYNSIERVDMILSKLNNVDDIETQDDENNNQEEDNEE